METPKHPQVVDCDQVGPGNRSQRPGDGTVDAVPAHQSPQVLRSEPQDTQSFVDGAMAERIGEVALPRARWSEQQDVGATLQVVTCP